MESTKSNIVQMTGTIEKADTSIERQLTAAGARMVEEARLMRIESQADFDGAASILRTIKDQAAKIKDYWQPLKSKAKAAHQEIVDREKAMLTEITQAESIIKGTMQKYLDAVEKARRQAEEEARRRQQEEAERLLAEAVKAEESGDDLGSAVNLAMAQMVEEMPAVPAIETPTAQGISTRKTWKARVIDAEKVPAYVNGMEIRKIDMAALNAIARMTKGTAEIPGIELYEESTIAARV